MIGPTKNTRYYAKTKHVAVKFNFITNLLEEITLEYILVKHTVADPLTMPL